MPTYFAFKDRKIIIKNERRILWIFKRIWIQYWRRIIQIYYNGLWGYG